MNLGKEFYTIEAASGKVFYLIIDRDGQEEMVYFLTEITENDLLNVTTDNSETLPKNSAALESQIPVTESALPNNNTDIDDTHEVETPTETPKEPQETEPEEPAEEECEIAPAEEETPAEEEEEAPVVIDFAQEEPQVVVLGDVLGGEQTTVADAIAVSAGPDVATVVAAGEVSLMKAVSLNDKMLLVRELFGGDSRLYEQSMEVLDSYESLDEAMLFIYDNFDWNPNSEGAKLLVDLLMRKLL